MMIMMTIEQKKNCKKIAEKMYMGALDVITQRDMDLMTNDDYNYVLAELIRKISSDLSAFLSDDE